MKTNLEKLLAATSVGKLESDGAHLMAEHGTIALSTLRNRVENPQNFQRIALSWNRFPEAVELLRMTVKDCPNCGGTGVAIPHPRCNWCEPHRALLATIEKEAQ